MCGGLEVSTVDVPWILQCPALQSNPKVKIAQQAVRDSGLIKLDHPAYSRDIICSK